MSKLPPKQGIVKLHYLMSATAIAYRVIGPSPVAESITHRMFDIV